MVKFLSQSKNTKRVGVAGRYLEIDAPIGANLHPGRQANETGMMHAFHLAPNKL
jgi:hypothetical protein